MDAGGSEHAGSVFQEDGGAGADLFWRLPVTALRGPERNEAWPADDAYVVSVGGTDLVTASAGGPWKSETAWVDSGGGISPDQIAVPSWQKAAINSTNKGSTVYRNGPDVAANANFTFYTSDDQQACLADEYGGTSFAAPMWAAYTALINQQLAANGEQQYRLSWIRRSMRKRHGGDVQGRFSRHHEWDLGKLLGGDEL